MSKPLSEVELEPGRPGLWYVPVEDTKLLLGELFKKYGSWDSLAIAYAAEIDGSPFAAHRSLWHWRTGKHRCVPDSYDRLWCML